MAIDQQDTRLALTDDPELEGSSETALEVAGAYVAPAKFDAMMAMVPTAHPATVEILERLSELKVRFKGTLTPLPTSLGGNPSASKANAEFHSVESRLDPTLIYDCGLYTKTELDEEYERDPKLRERLHRAMERGHIYVNGIVAQYNFEPVLVLERPQDPDDPYAPCYAIIGGWVYWQMALATGQKWVEGLAFGDMPNYHARDVSLRLARMRAAPLKWEVIRQLVHMQAEYNDGERTIEADRRQPSPMALGGAIEEIVGCSPAYASRVMMVIKDPDAGPMVEEHLLPPATAYPIVSRLKGGTHAETRKTILAQAASEHWSRDETEARVTRYLADQRAPRQSPEAKLRNAAERVVGLLATNADALQERFGEDKHKGITALATRLLKEINAALS